MRPKDEGKVEQIIGREGEIATFLKRSLVSPTLRSGGFAPRQFNRSVASLAVRIWFYYMRMDYVILKRVAKFTACLSLVIISCIPSLAQNNEGRFTLRRRATLVGHNRQVESIALSSNNQFLATSDDRETRLWNTATEQLITVLDGVMARFSPDGNVLATTRGKVVNLWDAATGAPKVSLTGHEKDVSSVAFSPDGQRVATGSTDGTAKIWDATTGRTISSLVVHQVKRLPRYRIVSRARRCCINLYIAVSGLKFDGSSTIYGHKTLFMQQSPRALSIPVRVFVSFSPNGSSILAQSYQSRTAKLFDAVTGQLQAELGGHTQEIGVYITQNEPTEVWRASFSPDGRFIVTESIDTAKLWEAATGRLRDTVGLLSVGTFSPDGRLFGLVKKNGIVGLLNIETGNVQALNVNTSFLNQMVFSSDSQTLVIGSGYKDYRATFIEVRTGRVKANVPLVSELGFDLVSDYQKNVDLLSFHPNNRIVMGANHGSIRLWDAATGQLITETNEGRDPAAFSSNGKMIVAAGANKKTILLWEAMNN
ncbi:MAG: WD40 repeat domain-containing protein [Pyrinomonadaceae bacterium]